MRDPIKRRLGNNHVQIYAWGAAPYIKEALRLDADVWITAPSPKNPAIQHVLSHNAANRPISKLPWPLSKIQSHDVEWSVFVDEALRKSDPRFKNATTVCKWEQVDLAIEGFLKKVPPESIITIQVN